MFALRCEFHTQKSLICNNDSQEVLIFGCVNGIFDHRTTDSNLLHIIHRNMTFSRLSDIKN